MTFTNTTIPAHAGVQVEDDGGSHHGFPNWAPAFAGAATER
ncbi:hypothetical protein ACYZX9_07725 [Sphingomonas citri]